MTFDVANVKKSSPQVAANYSVEWRSLNDALSYDVMGSLCTYQGTYLHNISSIYYVVPDFRNPNIYNILTPQNLHKAT